MGLSSMPTGHIRFQLLFRVLKVLLILNGLTIPDFGMMT